MGVKLGISVVPDATDPASTLEQIVVADRSGLDLVGVQDHPYQRRFFDTWTLLSFVAARTERIQLVTDVANLPLRPPAMLAKAAASLDVLSRGRFELGLGAGAFWDAVEAMGGPRRTAKDSVDALEEAIAILRAFWAAEDTLKLDGRHYTVNGVKPAGRRPPIRSASGSALMARGCSVSPVGSRTAGCRASAAACLPRTRLACKPSWTRRRGAPDASCRPSNGRLT
jgi:alkanesulfonate monooxygenase SsuD/methylene tetrahydromethanopterin reductase-like flavin-dependent oxidoreductase (luciferase family)